MESNVFKPKPLERVGNLSVQLPAETLKQIDEFADRAELNRSAMVRELLRLGFEAASRLLEEANQPRVLTAADLFEIDKIHDLKLKVADLPKVLPKELNEAGIGIGSFCSCTGFSGFSGGDDQETTACVGFGSHRGRWLSHEVSKDSCWKFIVV